jgi:CO/xanthine dehydrogenase Mo-binding subunit
LAAKQAAVDLRDQLKQLAAQFHELPESEVEVRGGQVFAGSHEPTDMGALLKAAGVASLIGTGGFKTEIGVDDEGQGKASHHWHQASAAAVVEVDRETGKVTLLRLHLSTHAGRVIDRPNAELQNEGCAAFGLSQALFEEMLFDGGQLTNPNLSDYNIAAMEDFPATFTTTLAESPDPDAEVHGLGETGLPAVPPAIGNAVRDAIGASVNQIPLTPERVLAAVEAGQ